MKRCFSCIVVFCLLISTSPLTFSFSGSAIVPGKADTSAVTDSLLRREIERETSEKEREPGTGDAPRPLRVTNPEISAIGDLRALYRSPAERNFDFEFHEAELSFRSAVDPYARADFYLSIGPDPEGGEYHIELEEAFLTTLSLPANLQIKAGQFRSSFGRINLTHPHALSIVALPLANVNYLGDEGLKDVGVSVSWLVPNPFDFYQELTFEFTSGPWENPSFARSTTNRFLYLGHLKNFWDLTQNATLELGLSGAAGPNQSDATTVLGGLDITYKWKPLRYGTYHSVVIEGEAIYSSRRDPVAGTVASWGGYLLCTYQLDQRLFLTGRLDYSNLPTNSSFVERGYSATLGWLATEFQKVELEYMHTSSNSYPSINQINLRSVFVIGAHGAHRY